MSEKWFKNVKVGTHLFNLYGKSRHYWLIESLFVLEIFLGNFFQHFIPAGLTCQVQSGTKLVLVEKKGRESYLQEGQDFSPLSLQAPHMRSPSGH